jgi:hypothetical protein
MPPVKLENLDLPGGKKMVYTWLKHHMAADSIKNESKR